MWALRVAALPVQAPPPPQLPLEEPQERMPAAALPAGARVHPAQEQLLRRLLALSGPALVVRLMLGQQPAAALLRVQRCWAWLPLAPPASPPSLQTATATATFVSIPFMLGHSRKINLALWLANLWSNSPVMSSSLAVPTLAKRTGVATSIGFLLSSSWHWLGCTSWICSWFSTSCMRG